MRLRKRPLHALAALAMAWVLVSGAACAGTVTRIEPPRAAVLPGHAQASPTPVIYPVPDSPEPRPSQREDPTSPSPTPLPPHAKDATPFQGLGTWIDIYDDASWSNPRAAVAEMRRRGVHTLYLQTSNFSRPFDIFLPAATSTFITEAHAAGIAVVAWYLPGLATMHHDLEASRTAIAFRTTDGQTFDGFGLDIESQILDPPGARTEALLSLSRELRAMAGDLPLAAVTPSPVALETPPNGWPEFPWTGLNQYYDAFVPMDYFASRAHGRSEVRAYVELSAQLIREHTGDPTVAIAPIGGLAQVVSGEEARGFVDAIAAQGLEGGSLYDFHTTSPAVWGALQPLR